MEARAVISQTTTDYPKIKVTANGAEVTFELFDISVDELRKLTGRELIITLK